MAIRNFVLRREYVVTRVKFLCPDEKRAAINLTATAVKGTSAILRAEICAGPKI